MQDAGECRDVGVRNFSVRLGVTRTRVGERGEGKRGSAYGRGDDSQVRHVDKQIVKGLFWVYDQIARLPTNDK